MGRCTVRLPHPRLRENPLLLGHRAGQLEHAPQGTGLIGGVRTVVARDGFCDWFRQVPAVQDLAGELGMRDADVAFFVVGKATVPVWYAFKTLSY